MPGEGTPLDGGTASQSRPQPASLVLRAGRWETRPCFRLLAPALEMEVGASADRAEPQALKQLVGGERKMGNSHSKIRLLAQSHRTAWGPLSVEKPAKEGRQGQVFSPNALSSWLSLVPCVTLGQPHSLSGPW